MQTVVCPSCDGVFPSSQIPALLHATRCPRCDEPLAGPRRQRVPFVAAKLTPVDFVHPAFCSSCGCVLSLPERAAGRSTICHFPLCHHKRAVAAAIELQQKTVDELAQRENEDMRRVEETLEKLGFSAKDRDIAILPAFTRPLVGMSDKRKHALAERLAEIAAEISLGPREENTASYEVTSAPETTTGHVAYGCATCGGYCCKNGADRAYLTRQTLTRVLASSGATLEDVLRTYLERVPAQSHADSCIYHTDRGCNLPFEMRSDTCNDFFCTGIRSLTSTVGDNASQQVIAAAVKGNRVVRLALIDGAQMNYLLNESNRVRENGHSQAEPEDRADVKGVEPETF